MQNGKAYTSFIKKIKIKTNENIKYIAFEYALGGFIPREANEVFQKKYGDCKDNSSILFKMLEIAGLQGNLTWIGTRKIPYTYEEVPTRAVDNHMILSYENKNNTYLLPLAGLGHGEGSVQDILPLLIKTVGESIEGSEKV